MAKAPIRVAIVDDEPAVRTPLARYLDASSFETKTYGSAREFIESIGGREPEGQVVDVPMPDFTGLTCSVISIVSTKKYQPLSLQLLMMQASASGARPLAQRFS